MIISIKIGGREMVCNVYFGELVEQPEQKESPFDVLKWKKELKIGTAILSLGDKYFEKAFQCDWGSFVWRCTKKQLEVFQEKEKVEIPELTELSEETNYGIVFIEMS